MGNPSLLPQCPRRPFLPLPGNAPRGEPSLDPVSPPCLIPTPGNLHHYCYERCQKCGSDNFLRHLDNSWRLGQDQQGPLGSLCVCVCVYIYKLFFRFFSIIGYSYDIPGQKEGGRLFLMKEESININIMCNTRLTMGRTESSSDAL